MFFSVCKQAEFSKSCSLIGSWSGWCFYNLAHLLIQNHSHACLLFVNDKRKLCFKIRFPLKLVLILA